MSRHNRKNLSRRIKRTLVERQQRPREGRHGKAHVRRKRMVVTGPDGQLRVKFEWVPVLAPFAVKVASGPTGDYGKPNKPESMAPRGKAGAKP